jgi:phospholipase C
MFNGLIGIELNPLSFFSIVAQMNIKTSPISNNIEWSWNRIFGTDFKKYSLPQTNILVGFIFKYKEFRWQFYVEEDAITNQGIDIAINFSFSHTFSLNRIKIKK